MNDKKIFFSERSGENVCGKLIEMETTKILLEKNQPATWKELNQNDGEYTLD